MRQKAINFTAWIGILLWSLGLTFKVNHWAGASLFLILTALFTVLFFIPLFFYLPNKEIEQHYIYPKLRWIQGLCFSVISLYPVFIIQHYPYQDWLFWGCIVSIPVLAFSFYKTRNIRLRRPQLPALLTVLAMSCMFIYFLKKLRNNGVHPQVKAIHAQLLEENKHLEAYILGAGQEPSSNLRELITLIDSMHVQVYIDVDSFSVSQAKQRIEQQLLPQEWYSGRSSELHLYGRDTLLNANTYGSAEHLKSELAKILPQIFIDIPALKTLPSLNLTDRWSKDAFNVMACRSVFHLQLIKNLVLTELLKENKNLNPDLAKYFESQTVVHFGRDLDHINTTFQENYEKDRSFFLMMIPTFFLVIFMFFLPRLKIKDKWKVRVLLFIVVIVFEFVLLIIDSFVGVFSQSPINLLFVNILLALGLVTLDNFLRNNYLKWFKEE